jgi:hypothetical protein
MRGDASRYVSGSSIPDDHQDLDVGENGQCAGGRKERVRSNPSFLEYVLASIPVHLISEVVISGVLPTAHIGR